uniref:hypothetical protein n=1 Tax=Salmonella sp. s54412 TaxID=3160128 RepID=UPI0037551718
VGLSEKQKKKVFRDILGGLIGKEVGKMFQDDITILNLPSPPEVLKESPPRLMNDEREEIGLIKLFEPSQESLCRT